MSDPTDVDDQGQQDDKSAYLIPEKPKNTPFFLKRSFYVPFGLALIYGFILRLSFGSSSSVSTLTYGFLFFVPVALGAITVYFEGRTFRVSWTGALFMPWGSAVIFLCGVALVNLEVSICLLMASPIFFGAASIGGLVMNAILRMVERSPGTKNSAPVVLVALMIVPYVVSGAESRTPPPDQYHVVDTQIIINADAQTVWDNIVRVPRIRPEEHHTRISHVMGIPQPVAATLDFDGPGGVRHAYYDNGLTFIERITDWQPLELLRFTIKVDPNSPPPAPFNALGGPFDVLDGTYRIEQLPDGQILLHLSSTQRISTRINSYGSLWTEYLMADLQNYILEIVRARCEQQMNH